MGLLATALLCTALIPGCPRAETPNDEASPPVGAFQISYQRSGGLETASSELNIGRGRHAVASVDRPPAGARTVRFRVGVRRILSLRHTLEAAGFGKLRSPPPGNCADCFHYDIRYRGHTVSFDDSTMPAPLRPLVSQLETVITVHTVPASD